MGESPSIYESFLYGNLMGYTIHMGESNGIYYIDYNNLMGESISTSMKTGEKKKQN